MAQPAQVDAPIRHGSGATVEFCSSCGALSERPAGRRVCPRCGLGVLLSCPAEALPGEGAAFLVVDRDLVVSAASAAAERLLRLSAAGSTVPELVSGSLGELRRQLARAASGLSGTATLEVSLNGRRGSFEARVSPCGPPRAALLVLAR